GEDGAGGDALGGGEVALHEDGGEREDVADVVEAVADSVVGEVLGGVGGDADGGAGGVVGLRPGEPAGGGGPRVGPGAFVGVGEGRPDQPGKCLDLGRGGPRPGAGGHLARLHHLQDVLPDLAVPEQGGGVLVAREDQVGALDLGVVAVQAVL